VLWPQSLFSDSKRLLIESEGPVRLVPQFMEAREIMKTFSCFRMVGSTLLVSNGENALVERLGLLVVALLSIEVGQPVEREGDLGMGAAQRLFMNRQGAPIERLGLLVLGALEQIVC